MSGDSTLEATEAAIQDVLSEEADDHFVFLLSDANLRRYGIQVAVCVSSGGFRCVRVCLTVVSHHLTHSFCGRGR
jgi:hypothetical protein